LKGITFRLSDFFFFNKGLEHESGFFIATPCIHVINPQSTVLLEKLIVTSKLTVMIHHNFAAY